MLNFKRFSYKMAFIVGLTVIIVGAIIAFYMEIRITTEISNNAKLDLQYQLNRDAEECDRSFLESTVIVKDMRNLAEAVFDIDEYKNDAERYADENIRPSLDDFVRSIVESNSQITGAYFAVNPNLSDTPYVFEVYYSEDYESGTNDVIQAETQTYEEYMKTDSPDMEWFYGAFSSGKPYWAGAYLWNDGTTMVSYSEPVMVGNVVIGVVGIDILIDYIEDTVKSVSLYETGIALMSDNLGMFLKTNDIVDKLTDSEKDKLLNSTKDKPFELKLNGEKYIAARNELVNGGSFMLLAPMDEVDAEIMTSILRFVIIFTVAIIIVFIISFLIGKSIGKPMTVLSEFIGRAGETGNVRFTDADIANIERLSVMKDEIGDCIRETAKFFKYIRHVSRELDRVANGDLTTDVKLLSDSDVMGKALSQMIRNLNKMFGGISTSTALLNNHVQQITDGSQDLAQGSIEQSSSLQQLSSSVSEIAEKTKINADIAGKAAELGNTIMENAEKGNRQMSDMMEAVKEINVASQQISKVIKVIDDIAFQTNILALNASVEAARAGQHGKGFAVVAEEVRNLAGKSAEAARETGDLIANSTAKAELGNRIAGDTSASLDEIVAGITESSMLITQIAQFCNEQSESVLRINSDIEHVTKVVHQNSATAEESAAASEEMSGQSHMLDDLITQFKLKE